MGASTPLSSEVMTSSFSAEDKKDGGGGSGGSSDSSSGGPQQGLGPTGVALVVLFTALTVLAGVFLYARRKKSLGSRYAELGSDSTHDSKDEHLTPL